tara:strand:+ start:1034 stop:1684 length:651 start_codon:yes stop_codon:yes gene_type:complete
MKLQLLILIILSIPVNLISSEFNITRLKYQGGGDWYSDPSSIPNLLDFIEKETGIKTADSEIQATIGSSNFFNNPYYYITGHGNIKFSQKEREILREALLDGAFLHADDNYGMNDSFRKEMKEIFPDKEWVQLPPSHKIFNILFKFADGLPKIHEHDGEAPQALALFHNDKIIVLYTYQSDLGDGWENRNVHNHTLDLHKTALKMGTNIVIHYLTN